MNDGSRRFAALPETFNARHPQWEVLRDWVRALPGATLTDFMTDDITEAWIDFAFCGQTFSINNQFGEWWFFVSDPGCPDDVLERVVAHFETLLSRAR
jgi:hypothetical protein